MFSGLPSCIHCKLATSLNRAPRQKNARALTAASSTVRVRSSIARARTQEPVCARRRRRRRQFILFEPSRAETDAVAARRGRSSGGSGASRQTSSSSSSSFVAQVCEKIVRCSARQSSAESFITHLSQNNEHARTHALPVVVAALFRLPCMRRELMCGIGVGTVRAER